MDPGQVLQDILKKVAEEQEYDHYEVNYKQIFTGGANYTSYLYLATITAPDKKGLNLFVKVAAIGEKMRSIAPFRIFEIESFFYRRLLGIYKSLEEEHKVPPEHRLVTPKFYTDSDECYKEALVLEDLTVAGYQSYDRFKSITWEYAKASVQNLAKLHALSVAWSIDDPETFKNSSDKLESEQNQEVLMEYMKDVVKNAIKVTREENKERLTKFLENKLKGADFNTYRKPMRCPVVAYGDYRPSNLMHKECEDGTIKIISVDYQTLQIGNPVLDLMYLIFNGSDKAFRKSYFKQTLEHYYSELRLALQRLDVDPDKVYSREDFDYEIEKILPFGLILSTFCLLIVTVQAEDAPKVHEGIEIKDFAVSPNELYAERLNDIIDDYIDMGIL